MKKITNHFSDVSIVKSLSNYFYKHSSFKIYILLNSKITNLYNPRTSINNYKNVL